MRADERQSAGAILVTGASGFIGSALVARLRSAGIAVRAAYRRAPAHAPDAVSIGEIGPATDWSAALRGVSAIVHLAGIAHGRGGDLRRVNVDGVRALTAQGASAGVLRFVFVSSVKAGGERSGAPLRDDDPPLPMTPYGRAKREAEEVVLAQTGLAPVILRPPLVIGAGAKANAALLLRLCDSGLPLPLANAAARRSVMNLSGLLDAIMACVDAPLGAAGPFYIADQPSLAVHELVTHLRRGMGRAPALFSAPQALLPLPAALRTSLEVDDRAFRAAYPALRAVRSAQAMEDAARAWKRARG